MAPSWCKMCRSIGQKRLVMNNFSVGLRSAKHLAHIPYVCAGIFCAAVFASLVSAPPVDARRSPGQYLIPPPPPTPVLAVPPPPVMLPYSEAYANYRTAPTPAAMATMPPNTVPALPTSKPVRSTPNFTGLSLNTAISKGFGKPRLPYKTTATPGAAMAANHTDAPVINTWFDSSLRWYATHRTTTPHYDSMSMQAPYWRPDTQYEAATPPPQPMMMPPPQPASPPTYSHRHHRHARRVVAYR